MPVNAQTAPAAPITTTPSQAGVTVTPRGPAATSAPTAADATQDVTSPPAAADAADIVVTGTLLRGVAPTGTNVVNLTREAIAQTGATNLNQVLARIPQITSAFGQQPTISGTDLGSSIVRPNLRNLGAAGGSTTLILVDGHRQVDAGILITSPDPDVIPPAVLERVDVVPDGGSSIYGSDAVGGVINFITRKRFDGFEASGRYGFADKYKQYDTNLTAGKDWGSGSAYISFNYARNDALLGIDRGYARQVSPQNGFCSPGTVVVNRAGVSTSYALPDRVAGTVAQCDNTDDLSIIPTVERTSEFASLTQRLGDGIDLDVKAFHTRRETTVYQGVGRATQNSGTISSTNPYYVPIGPNDPGTQTVNFTYGGAATPKVANVLEEFGITPTIAADLGSTWELRVLGNFQRSTVTQDGVYVDANAQANALAGTTLSTALNPYNIAATNLSVINGILGTQHDFGRQNLINGRVIVDGTAFSLPGGDVRLALGAEVIRQTLRNSISGSFVGATSVARNVKSLFGEVAVPIVGAGNAMSGISSLTLSASGRYDDYSDFGSTFNPKLGVTYKPIDWITIRGNWGKSFNAPSLADKNGAPDTRAVLIPVSPWTDPTDPSSVSSRPTILIAGGNGALQPQKADTWSLGADIKPVSGLTLSTTYYNIRLRNQIGIIPIFTGNPYIPAYSAYYIKNPTLAQAQAVVGSLPLVGGTSLESLYSANGSPYVLLDARRQNLGLLRQDGLDFNANYITQTGFGSVNGTIGGTYTLTRKIAGAADQPFINDLKTPGASRLSLLAALSASVENATGSLTWTHRAGYDVNPAIATQTQVGAFDTVDLFLSYGFKAGGLLNDLALTLNVNNIANERPPFYGNDPGYTNGSTVGRLVQLGINKKF